MPPTIGEQDAVADLKSKLREASALPSPKATIPTRTIRAGRRSRSAVKSALAFSDSATPRTLSAATSSRKTIETGTTGMSTNTARLSPEKPRASVLADVIPEAMTAKATMKVKNWPAERPVRVQGGARRARVLGDELGVGERGQRGEHEGGEERGPDRAADLGSDLADERVDAAAEHVADDEQQQQAGPDRAAQLRRLLAGPSGRGAVGDFSATPGSYTISAGSSCSSSSTGANRSPCSSTRSSTSAASKTQQVGIAVGGGSARPHPSAAASRRSAAARARSE